MRRRARILSDSELTALDWELRAQFGGAVDLTACDLFTRLMKDKPEDGRVFPNDGYLSWQHRWFMGTGVRPKGW